MSVDVIKETERIDEISKELWALAPEARCRILSYLWDLFAMDDFKREKQIAIQKQLKEAQK